MSSQHFDDGTRTDRTAGEVDWQQFLERTPATERKRTSKFSVTLANAHPDGAAGDRQEYNRIQKAKEAMVGE